MKVGGAVAVAAARDRALAELEDAVVVHGGRAADLRRDGARRARRSRSSAAAASPTQHALDGRPRGAARGQPRALRARSARAPSAWPATRSASRRRRVPELGHVGDPLPSRPQAVLDALAAGLIPVVAPLAEGPLNVNADEAAAALAVGLGAERILFLTDVPGVLRDERVLDRIDADEVDAARDGVRGRDRAEAPRRGRRRPRRRPGRDRRDGGGRVMLDDPLGRAADLRTRRRHVRRRRGLPG